MIFKSTKTFYNLPCSHQQWQDADESGNAGTGQCAQTHGYSRSFAFEFCCNEVDDYGWVIGFGSLKKVKNWLEYMFDHTSLWEASDPRIDEVVDANDALSIPMYNMRILPSGVSMEQTALFVSSYMNPYIYEITGGRCWISKLEVRENDKNSGILEMTEDDAKKMIKNIGFQTTRFPKLTRYEMIEPKDLIALIEGQDISDEGFKGFRV